ncbi:YbhB/YbcL family Raf kinase inhibitor-like protein [Chachezhania sediminis]|uniref:hypothetical protein n=1 Tax=Chachezhania sediminis TaxID=2599291 RepID=UPI001E5B72CB|nr:hypothetical protein [Chachezhania sediminis]
MRRQAFTGLLAAAILSSTIALADMAVQLLPPWDGKTVPPGQQCTEFGGNGGTPPMKVTGIPAGAKWLIGYFNDKDYSPLSKNGGHGTIGWPVKGTTMELKPVPGMTDKLPGGAVVIKPTRAKGKFISPGYLPPCSGGRKNRYAVDLVAVDSAGKALAQVKNVMIGRY